MFVEQMITDDLKLCLFCQEVRYGCTLVLKEFIESVQSIQNITYKICANMYCTVCPYEGGKSVESV
jgi:hypothetical protein